MSIFLFKSFIPSIFNCLSIVQKHLAQTCGSTIIADSQTFNQMSVFNGKMHNLQMQKYDVSRTSPISGTKEYLPIPAMEFLFAVEHTKKIL